MTAGMCCIVGGMIKVTREATETRRGVRAGRAGRVLAGLASGILLGIANASAAAAVPDPGDLDSHFAGSGKTTLDIQSYDTATAVAIDAQRRILVAGWSTAATNGDFSGDFVVARYMPDGSLDSTFGSDGIVRTDFNGRDDKASAMALDDRGRIVVAGTSRGPRGASDAALARYRPNGDLDASLGGDGKAVVNLGGYDNEVYAMAIDSQGRILVAGRQYRYHDVFNILDFVVARFDAGGALDPSFGRDGTTTTDFGQMDFAYGLALDPQGRIVAAGESEFETASFVLARYEPNGRIDASFGTDGKVGIALGGDFYEDYARAVTVDASGRVLAAGGANSDSGADFVLARYGESGQLDPSFGTSGTVTTSFSDYASADAVLIDNQGRIVAAGTKTVGGSGQFALARYRADGSLDGSFGSHGRVTTPFGRRDDTHGTAVAMDDRGRIVVVGRVSESDSDSDFAVARYIGHDKAPPDVTVKGRSRFRTRHHSRPAHFRLVASEPVEFECRLDGRSFHGCSSPYRTRMLALGRHRLKVRATDEAGNVGADKKRFRVVEKR